MNDIATKQFDLKREYLQQKLWKNFDTWLVVRITELEQEILYYFKTATVGPLMQKIREQGNE